MIKNILVSHMLVPVVAVLLVTAQATWGTAIKTQQLLEGPPLTVITNILTSPRMWIGVFLYIVATGVYFKLLSKAQFFSVQISMTAIAILLSTLLAATLFHEKLTVINVSGMFLVIIGLALVLAR